MPESLIALPHGTLRLAVSARTDVGRVRSVNEDDLLVSAPLFAVADGMGGHERGDLASKAAVDALESGHDGRSDAVFAVDDVFSLVGSANDAVRGLATDGLCGTTLTGLVLAVPDEASSDHPGDEGMPEWTLFNVGDSRVYRWDGRTLAQLTVDHSAVQELVNAGILTREEAEEHPERNIITRALGAEDTVDVDVWTRTIAARETFLVCSDGLTKELSDDRLTHLFARRDAKNWQWDGFASLLVQEALDAGGHDNVTAIVIDSVFERDADER